MSKGGGVLYSALAVETGALARANGDPFMRLAPVVALLALLAGGAGLTTGAEGVAATAEATTAPAAGKVVLHRAGQPEVDAATLKRLGDLSLDLLKSANFNTVTHAEMLRQSVPAVQARYRKVVAGDYLVVTYEQPMTVKTVGGEVTVYEIVIALLNQGPVGVFTIDGGGRVVAHEKYGGRPDVEMRKVLRGAGGRE